MAPRLILNTVQRKPRPDRCYGCGCDLFTEWHDQDCPYAHEDDVDAEVEGGFD